MQLVLLSAAAQRDDGLIVPTKHLAGAAAHKAGGRLVRLGLAAERIARPGEPRWRDDGEGQYLALTITKAGLAALGLSEPFAEAEGARRDSLLDPAASDQVDQADVGTCGCDRAARLFRPSRTATKKALVVELLGRADGTTIATIVAATGWLQHTARAALTGLRHDGLEIVTLRKPGEPTRYQIASRSERQTADIRGGATVDTRGGEA
jgi:hypothetical protein